MRFWGVLASQHRMGCVLASPPPIPPVLATSPAAFVCAVPGHHVRLTLLAAAWGMEKKTPPQTSMLTFSPPSHTSTPSFRGLFWKAARIGEMRLGLVLRRGGSSTRCFSFSLTSFPSPIFFSGERLSPWVALSCFAMAFTTLFS